MEKVAIEHADSYRLEVVKETLRRCFADIGLPKDNPLGGIVKPGNKVFIKPNWVASRWRKSCPHKDTLYSVITHPNVIEAMADFVAEALEGQGEIYIGDNPEKDALAPGGLGIRFIHFQNPDGLYSTCCDTAKSIDSLIVLAELLK